MIHLKVTSPLGVNFLEIQLGTDFSSCSIRSSTSPTRKHVKVEQKFKPNSRTKTIHTSLCNIKTIHYNLVHQLLLGNRSAIYRLENVVDNTNKFGQARRFFTSYTSTRRILSVRLVMEISLFRDIIALQIIYTETQWTIITFHARKVEKPFCRFT